MKTTLHLPTSTLRWLGSALLLVPLAAAAEDPKVFSTSAAGHEVGELDLELADGAIQLSLDDAIATALERNLSLSVERTRHSRFLYGVLQARGIYDLQLEADGGLSSDTRPPRSALEDADVITSDTAFLNLGASQLTPWGGTGRVDWDNSEFESSDLFTQPNPQFAIGLDFQFTQPLLRGFGRESTERDLLVARTNVGISRQNLQVQVEEIVQQVSDRYWELVEAREQLAVSQESLDLAGELHEMNRIQVEVGTLAPLELVQSEAGVATREEEIIRRQAAVEDGADALRRLLNLDRGELWATELVPVTEAEIERREIDLDEAVETAWEERPDLVRARLDTEILGLDARVAENLKKPRFDVVARYGYNALDGDRVEFEDPFDPDPDELLSSTNRDYFDALDQITGLDYEGWSLQFIFGYPLQNRTARARSAIADLALEQGLEQVADLELQVMTEVRRTARAVETAAKQIESAKVSSKLARKNLEAEQKRYENGLSTSFRVLEIQEDLSEARSREVSAIVGYRRALVAFTRSIGRLLDEHDIVLEVAEIPGR